MAIQALSKQTKAMHVSEIANAIIRANPEGPLDAGVYAKTLSSVLSKEAKRKGSRIGRLIVKGVPKKGTYRLKKKLTPKIIKLPPPQIGVSTAHVGMAGENAVLSELLFYGYNAAKMQVDDGIDIVASKDKTFFHIQVKTSTEQKGGKFYFKIKRDRLLAKAGISTFYVFVLRRDTPDRYANDYLILPNYDVEKYDRNDVIKGAKDLSLTISMPTPNRFKLNGTVDVSSHINAWSHALK